MEQIIRELRILSKNYYMYEKEKDLKKNWKRKN